jgi:hypothetical protein
MTGGHMRIQMPGFSAKGAAMNHALAFQRLAGAKQQQETMNPGDKNESASLEVNWEPDAIAS